MISIQHLYSIVEEDRKKLFGFFNKTNKKHFHDSIIENVWSPELIFRHLLMNIYWMLEKLPDSSAEPSKLAFDLENEVNDQASLDEVLAEFDTISPILNEQLSLLTLEQEEEEIDMWKGKMKRRIYLVRLINHEHRHIGQIQWLLKRSTGWTDDELYGVAE
ncbi:MAG: DinB family protein [Candidatus Heimdallarchaeaceae archaeon]